MDDRYIVLVHPLGAGDDGAALRRHACALSAMGLAPRLETALCDVFVSPETPVLAIPGGIAIGHVFYRDGTPATATPPALASPEQVVNYLLAHCWGNYVLVQARTTPVPRLEVLRDPSGGLPCIHAITSGHGFITSDIALATRLGVHRRGIDWDFMPQALAYPQAKTTRTGLVGIRELLPGCSLLVEGNAATVRQDWSPWTFVAKERRHRTPEEAASEVRSSVFHAVSAWAEADKSILLELSGGLDSSIVASCLRRTSAQVTCYNLATPVPGADERRYASLMADVLGVGLRSETLRSEDARFSFPIPESAVNPRVAALQYAVDCAMDRAADAHGAASFFSGGGGDTVFCYLRSAAPAADAFWERGIKRGVSAVHDLSTLHQCTFWKASRLTLRKLLRRDTMSFKADRTFLDPARPVDPPPPHPWLNPPPNALVGDRERIIDLAGTQVFREVIPRAGKRPMRLPLLSQPVVEACLKVPAWMWIAGGRNRAIARAAFADALPRDILHRTSKGSFTNYVGIAFRHNRRQIRDFLLQGHLREHGLLDIRTLERCLAEDAALLDATFMRILSLCAAENWVRNQPRHST